MIYKKIVNYKSNGGTSCTAIFVVNNSQHIDIFLPLHRYLCDFKILYVYVGGRGTNKSETEKYLASLNITYITVGNLFIANQISFLFKKICPDVVVLAHDTNFPNQKIIQLTKKINVPTLLIQDGIYAENSVYTKIRKTFTARLSGIPNIIITNEYSVLEKIEILLSGLKFRRLNNQFVGRGGCTRIAVFGDATRKLLEKEGVESKRIIVTGSTKFDYLHNIKFSENSPVYQDLNICPHKRAVLLITQPFVESGIWTKGQREKYISQIGMAINAINDCQLIIKIRQNRENISDYEQLLKSHGIIAIICKEINLIPLIKISDVIITVSSTGGLETIASEKPLVIFDPFDTPGSSFYDSADILFLRTITDLPLTVKKILLDETFYNTCIQNQYSFLEETIFQNDGRAAERIYGSMVNIIKKNKP